MRRQSHFTTCQWCRHKKQWVRERGGRGSRRDTKMSTGTSEVVNQPQWRRFSTAPLLCSLPFPPGVYTFIWLIGFSAAYRNCGALEWLKSAQLLWGKWKIWLPDSYAYAGSCHTAQKWRNFRTNMSPMSVPRNTLRQQRRQGGKEKKRERERLEGGRQDSHWARRCRVDETGRLAAWFIAL